MRGHAADEEASGVLVQRGGAAQEAGQQGSERSDGNQSAIIFLEKSSAEIGVAALHAGVRFADLEVAFHIVVAETPAPFLGLGAHLAQGFEDLEQAATLAPFSL